jgi:hypothetical protein
MSSNPINLALRFVLELAALVIFGYWGWQKGDGWLRFLFAIGLPLFFAVLWGVFRIPNDPNPAIVAIPGFLRLILELVFFSFAVWALKDSHLFILSWTFAVITFLHYVTSYDRIIWMIKQ